MRQAKSDDGGAGLLLLSIGLLSGTSLAFEILVMRLLSIVQWHHFAYMVISLALLGFGASGTFLSLFRDHLRERFTAVYLVNAVLFGSTLVAVFAVAQRLPFNPLQLVWEPRQTLYLSTLYLLLTIPFFCVANAIGLALDRFSDRIHRIYRADLIGAGLGAVLVIGLLFLVPPVLCLRILSGLGLVGAALAAWSPHLGSRKRLGGILLTAGVLLPFLIPSGWTELRISQFKALRQALNRPEAEIVARESGPMGLLTAVRSPEIPFRQAPGLSLEFPGTLPEQIGVFTDGGSLSVINRHDPATEPPRFLDYLTSALPYHLLDRPSVLVVGPGGGTEILSALAHGGRRIDAVEANPQMVELVGHRFDEFSGRLYRQPEVELHVAEARGFMARSEGSWDLIQIALIDSFASASSGVHASSENTLYTVESLAEMLDHLEPGGILALTRWVHLPLRDNLKLFATAVEALEARGEDRPERRLAWIRTWNTATLLVKAEPFGAGELETIRSFSHERSFDLAYLPGMREGEANRFNLLEEPAFFRGATALLGPDSASFLERYKFHVAPATDQKPYFSRFFKWKTLPELLRLRGRGGTPLIQWSYLVVVATAVQAAGAGILLILLPLLLSRAEATRAPGTGRMATFFLTLGLAFLFVEISMIHHLTLFLGHPLYSVAVVLGSFLLFAGLGSGASQALTERLRDWDPLPGSLRRRAVALPVAGTALLALLYLPALPWVIDRWIGLPDPLRIPIAILLLGPLAFLMGMPFPLGLARAGSRHPEWIPWAWGINGWASVVSAVLATLLAMHLGFSAVLGIAAVLYLLAAALLLRI
ncbi:MAG: SAM-dependent methyltransferase [Thermoanaerobaculia bacterium]|nr:SAM-dependent methyltransferase [Thermoanaerobaculia bacterium]